MEKQFKYLSAQFSGVLYAHETMHALSAVLAFLYLCNRVSMSACFPLLHSVELHVYLCI